MRSAVFLFVSSALAVLSAPAGAQVVEWSSAPMTCVPSAETAQAAKNVTTGGAVTFSAVSTAGGAVPSRQIVFLCPVSRPLPDGRYRIQASHKRAELLGLEDLGSPRVVSGTVQLRRRDVRARDGAVTTLVSHELASDAPLPAVPNAPPVVSSSSATALGFDFASYTYWVQITLRKGQTFPGSPSFTPTLYQAALIREGGASGIQVPGAAIETPLLQDDDG